MTELHSDPYPKHKDGCQEMQIITANLDNRRVRVMPSYKNTWDCPRCLIDRFSKKVQHVPGLSDELCMMVENTAQRAATKERARRRNSGYVRISLGDGRSIALGPPELYPLLEPEPAITALTKALKLGQENGITRISFSDSWRPERSVKYYTVPTFEKDKDQVVKALQDAGYEEGDRVHGSLDDFKSEIMARLGVERGQREDITGGYWGHGSDHNHT